MGRKKRRIIWERAAAQEAELSLKGEIEAAQTAVKEAKLAAENLELALAAERSTIIKETTKTTTSKKTITKRKTSKK